MQLFRNLSKQPEEQAKRSKKAARGNIEQSQPEPIDKQDPTQLEKAGDMTKGSRST
jgi:hypothetical protein